MTSQSSSPRPEPTSESYFVGKLAEYAKRPEIAAPATIDSLVAHLDYLSPDNIAEVRRAYEYAERAHDGQMRRTGHPYITHPTAVAQILATMRMDHQTLMAALLHDVIEDSDTSKSALGKRFGEPVAEIVDGLSKLTNIFNSRAEAQAENFQKMALAMAKDIRVIMVKLADRLHNMRTIGVMSDAAAQAHRPGNAGLLCAHRQPPGHAHHEDRTGRARLSRPCYPLRADRIQHGRATKRGATARSSWRRSAAP